MSHPNLDPAPPVAPTIGRLHWHTEHITLAPERYDPKTLTQLRAAAFALALAAGLGDEHRDLAALTTARAILNDATASAEERALAEERAVSFAQRLLVGAQRTVAALQDEIYRAQRDRARAAERGQR